MRLVYLAAIAGGIIAVALFAIVASTIPTKDYDLSVDALKDEQSLFTNVRVVLKNTGRLPITNVLVDYGGEKEPPIAILQPNHPACWQPVQDNSPDVLLLSEWIHGRGFFEHPKCAYPVFQYSPKVR